MNESEQVALAFTSPLHKRVVEAVRARVKLSHNRLARQRERWKQAEADTNAYVPETDADRLRKGKRKAGEPEYVTLNIPSSYAMLLSAHTYWTSALLGRTPIMQWAGRHGESEQQVLAVEALTDYGVQVGGALVPYYVWLYDMAKYGIGIVHTHWCEESAVVSAVEEEPVLFLGVPTGKTQRVRRTRKVRGYEGNKVVNVRPYDWIPDPRVSFAHFQKGEFCGRHLELSWNEVLKGKAEGRYFNVEELKKRLRGMQDSYRDLGHSTSDVPFGAERLLDSTLDPDGLAPIPAVEMQIELSPKAWGLGSSDYPEKWVFTVAGGEVVIGAQPLGYLHGQFCFDVMEYEIEGYNLSKRSMLEILHPLNETINWLVNTHFYNVRKVLNDQFIYDPSKLVEKDLFAPGAGRLIRLRPEAYGQPLNQAIMQLPVSDVTRQHMAESPMVVELMQRVSGVVDNIMGMVNTSGRKTATEVRTSSSFGVNRLKTVAEYCSALGFAPHAQKVLQNIQQLYSADKLFRIVGDNASGKALFQRITPDDIQGFYDFIPVDGTMPIDRFAMANLWKEILMGLRNIPEVGQTYNIPGIFSWTAKLAGLRNIDQFRLNAQDPEALLRQVQAGNMVPAGEVVNGRGAERTEADFARMAGAGQIPGLGPTQ